MDKHLTELEEEDIGECQGDSYTNIPSYSSTAFLGGKRDSHNGKDEGRERNRQSGILLDQRHLNIGITSHLLDAYHFIQLIVVHCLDSLFIEIEVLDTQRDDRIHLATATDIVSKIGIVFADEVLLQSPALLRGVIDSCLG